MIKNFESSGEYASGNQIDALGSTWDMHGCSSFLEFKYVVRSVTMETELSVSIRDSL